MLHEDCLNIRLAGYLERRRNRDDTEGDDAEAAPDPEAAADADAGPEKPAPADS